MYVHVLVMLQMKTIILTRLKKELKKVHCSVLLRWSVLCKKLSLMVCTRKMSTITERNMSLISLGWCWHVEKQPVCHCLQDFRLSTHTQATLILMSLHATRFLNEVSARTNVCELVQYEFQWRASIPKHPDPPVRPLLHVVSKKYCFFLELLMRTSAKTVTSLPEMSVALVLFPSQVLILSQTE